MAFYMDVSSMLSSFGVDIKVWPASKPHTGEKKLVGGFSIPSDKLSDADAETRHEPVVPINDLTAQVAAIIAGGSLTDFDLMWVSSGKYYKGTIVYVPSQGGYYRVTGLSNYHDYSNASIYELKGDDQHQDGRTTTSRSTTGHLRTSTGGQIRFGL